MANDMKYLSAEEEAKLLKPIDEYIGKIQKQIDALRKDGSDKVQELKTHISLVRENKNYTKEEQAEIIRKDKEQMVKAKETEAANKDKVSKPTSKRIIMIRWLQAVQRRRNRKMQNTERYVRSLKKSMRAALQS